MKISANKMVAIHYTLKNAQNEIIDSSNGGDPLEYLHGSGMLIPGLERELEGKSVGDKFSVIVEPAEGYGERSEDLVFKVNRSQFEEGVAIEPGMQFEAAGRIVTVIDVAEENITIDANHYLAGEKLFFDVEIVSVREATEEELSGSCGCGGSCGGCGSGSCGCEGGCGCN
ncbi:MAG: peptidylprolyl isomerase [Spirochaetaceae bacterium]|nr:peptidylprolyl isomerase [Spirochaetaceae bacterium]